MKNLQSKLQSWMKGRYGPDILSRDLSWFAIAFFVVYMILRYRWIFFLGLALMVFGYFRMFSKNYTKRYNENRVYTNMRAKITRPVSRFFKRIIDFPKYKYLTCPHCGKKLRVPRGKKEIVVKCPSCRMRFDAKS